MMRQIVLTAMLFVGALVASASAQATQPGGVSLEQRSLTPSAPVNFNAVRHTAGGSDLLSFSQMFSALLVVLSLIFAARWLVPKIWPAVVAQRNAAVRVLGRTPISAKNQIVLVQVGQRVLVLGENASQLSTLANIDDSNEVAMLVGKASVRPEFNAERDTPFASALAESNRAYASEQAVDPVEEPAAASPSGELSDLIGKVRNLARQLGRQ